jgi:hypothetical protein
VEFVIYPKDTAAVEVCLNFIQWNLSKPYLLGISFFSYIDTFFQSSVYTGF